MRRVLVAAALLLIITNGTIWAQSYQGRVDLHRAQLAGCHRGIADRLVHLRESEASWKANLIVASDPRQPAVTRSARRDQAVAEELAVKSYRTRVPPALDCDKAFPGPSLLPHF
jgi:hypothetical protein